MRAELVYKQIVRVPIACIRQFYW